MARAAERAGILPPHLHSLHLQSGLVIRKYHLDFLKNTKPQPKQVNFKVQK